jgi:hypothetical protein
VTFENEWHVGAMTRRPFHFVAVSSQVSGSFLRDEMNIQIDV